MGIRKRYLLTISVRATRTLSDCLHWMVRRTKSTVLQKPISGGVACLCLMLCVQASRRFPVFYGPLTPGENTTAAEFDLPLPVRSADQLLHLSNTEHGMLDVSYAAAWELGRLLTLQNTKVAVDLFNWKRAHAHDEQLLAAEHRLLHLPCEKSNTDISLPPIRRRVVRQSGKVDRGAIYLFGSGRTHAPAGIHPLLPCRLAVD